MKEKIAKKKDIKIMIKQIIREEMAVLTASWRR